MSSALPDPSTPPDNREETPTAGAVAVPVIVWLLIQLAAVALAASRVPLSANFPKPPQSLALHEMLVAQFVGSSVFLSVLFRGWRAWLVMSITAGLMLMVASTMSAAPIGRVMILWGHVVAWLTVLAIWHAAMPRRSDVVTAGAIFLTAGGLLLAYLHGEFQRAASAGWLGSLPLAAALHAIAVSPPFRSPFPSTSTGLIACGLVILAIMRAKRRETGQAAVTIV